MVMTGDGEFRRGSLQAIVHRDLVARNIPIGDNIELLQMAIDVAAWMTFLSLLACSIAVYVNILQLVAKPRDFYSLVDRLVGYHLIIELSNVRSLII